MGGNVTVGRGVKVVGDALGNAVGFRVGDPEAAFDGAFVV